MAKIENIANILVIAAHPDDEVLGCGGTISRLVKENQNVFITILGEGITSRYREWEQADERLTETLHADSRKVADLLGARDLFLYDLPDNRFDTVPLLSVVKIIEELVERIKPTVIYTHHGGDLNIDHAITHRAVLTATRPMVGTPVKDIFAFEVASSTEWSFQQFTPHFRPSVFFDIGGTIDKKIEAIKMYDSEVRSFPHPRSPEALKTCARRWGSVVGLQYAESFELIRSII